MAKKELIPDDLDIAILRLLPDEGSKLGKYLPDARTSQRIKKELDDPFVTSISVGRRMAELNKYGYAVRPKDDTAIGWQRTAEGKKVLDKVSEDEQ